MDLHSILVCAENEGLPGRGDLIAAKHCVKIVTVTQKCKGWGGRLDAGTERVPSRA